MKKVTQVLLMRLLFSNNHHESFADVASSHWHILENLVHFLHYLLESHTTSLSKVSSPCGPGLRLEHFYTIGDLQVVTSLTSVRQATQQHLSRILASVLFTRKCPPNVPLVCLFMEVSTQKWFLCHQNFSIFE